MRKGILSIGTTVIDSVKIIDALPEKSCVALVHAVSRHVGGNVPNVLIDLAVVGDDIEGDFILRELDKHKIDTSFMIRTKEAGTSASDVMTLSSTGERTVFYYKGASSLITLEQVEALKTNARIVQIAYIGTLDVLEEKDSLYRSKLARVLKLFKDKGCQTCIDIVSIPIGEHLKKVILSCLPYTDYFVVNEIETEALLGIETRRKDGSLVFSALKEAVAEFIKLGVCSYAVIHSPETAVCMDKNGFYTEQPSYPIEQSKIRGTVGAGDAFMAAFLYSMHEGYPIQSALKYGHASAFYNLQNAGAVEGAVPFETIKNFVDHTIL